MKAWFIDGYNGIGSLRLAEADALAPAAGEVILDVAYAGLNPADAYLAQKLYPGRPVFPHILGREAFGTLARIGQGVVGWSIGEPVLVLPGTVGVDRWGTFAQQVAIPADRLLRIPAGWDAKEAAASVLVYLTAWQALWQWGTLAEDSVVLVTGASGGVGSATVQLAAAKRLCVVALTRSDAKLSPLKELGASIALNCSAKSWVKTFKDELRGRRVTLAIDNIGGPLLPQVIDTLGMNGAVSVVGRLAGPVPEFNTATLFFRRLRIGGVAVSVWSAQEMHTEWAKLVGLLNSANRRPLVDQVFPFAQLPAAFARLAEGPLGKVLIDVRH